MIEHDVPPTMVSAFTTRIIARAVCEETGVDFDLMISPARHQSLFRARAATTWLARERLHRSFPVIGAALGRRDHSSIMHQFARASELRQRDVEFRALVDRVDAKLFGTAQ
ncbi:MAG TPA: helix-turn-helix domain-containing protein [Sphingobium sp.]